MSLDKGLSQVLKSVGYLVLWVSVQMSPTCRMGDNSSTLPHEVPYR